MFHSNQTIPGMALAPPMLRVTSAPLPAKWVLLPLITVRFAQIAVCTIFWLQSDLHSMICIQLGSSDESQSGKIPDPNLLCTYLAESCEILEF